jgi:hypothetical protein
MHFHPQDGRIKVQAGLPSDQLKIALTWANQAKILDFTTMKGAFTNFTNPEDWRKFANRVKNYGSIWCCVLAHPGHIHYDMLMDVPHTDKFGHYWNSTWTPKCGP